MSYKPGGMFNQPENYSQTQAFSGSFSNKGFTKPDLLYQFPSFQSNQSESRMTRSQIIDAPFQPSSKRPLFGQAEGLPTDFNSQKLPSYQESSLSYTMAPTQSSGAMKGLSSTLPLPKPVSYLHETKSGSPGIPSGLNFSYQAGYPLEERVGSTHSSNGFGNSNYSTHETTKAATGKDFSSFGGSSHLSSSHSYSSGAGNKNFEGSSSNPELSFLTNKFGTGFSLRPEDPLIKKDNFGASISTASDNFLRSNPIYTSTSSSNSVPVKEFFLKSPREGPGLAVIKEFDLPPKLDDKVFPEITNRKSGTMYQSDFLMRTSPSNTQPISTNITKNKNIYESTNPSDKYFSRVPLGPSGQDPTSLYSELNPSTEDRAQKFLSLERAPGTTNLLNQTGFQMPRRESGKEIKDFIPTSFDAEFKNMPQKPVQIERPLGWAEKEVTSRFETNFAASGPQYRLGPQEHGLGADLKTGQDYKVVPSFKPEPKLGGEFKSEFDSRWTADNRLRTDPMRGADDRFLDSKTKQASELLLAHDLKRDYPIPAATGKEFRSYPDDNKFVSGSLGLAGSDPRLAFRNEHLNPASLMSMETDDRTAIRHLEIVSNQRRTSSGLEPAGTVKPPFQQESLTRPPTTNFSNSFSSPPVGTNLLSADMKALDRRHEQLKSANLQALLSNDFRAGPLDDNPLTHVLINGEPVEISEDNIFGNDFVKTSKFVSQNPSFHAQEKKIEGFSDKFELSRPFASEELANKYKEPLASWQQPQSQNKYPLPSAGGQLQTKQISEFQFSSGLANESTGYSGAGFKADVSSSYKVGTGGGVPLSFDQISKGNSPFGQAQFQQSKTQGISDLRPLGQSDMSRPDIFGYSRVDLDSSRNQVQPQEILRGSRSDSVNTNIAELFKSLTLKMEDFEMGPSIGRGNFGNIYLARHTKSKFFVALKIISKRILKETETEAALAKEIKLQSQLKHPNIIQLYSFFYDENRIILVMEYATHGELFKELKDQASKRFSEEKAAHYVQQVAEAISYMHKKGIIHRDIKPENILNSFGVLKLSDFGWAQTGTNPRTSFCGTLEYVSPEVVENKEYSYSVDVWGLGVLCYELCSGKTPFEGNDSTSDTYLRIMDLKVNYPTHFSPDLRDFLEKIFIKDQNRRLNINQVLNHPWIVRLSGKTETANQRVYGVMKDLLG